MENLVLGPTAYTPQVDFDCNTGVLELKGTSIPENSSDFFLPLLKWFEAYLVNPAPVTTLMFKMEYFNTSSTVHMLRLMQGVAKLMREGRKGSIQWYHLANDEDFIEAGKDFAVLAKTEINLVQY